MLRESLKVTLGFLKKKWCWTGTIVDHTVLSPSHSASLICLNSPVFKGFPIATPPASMGRFVWVSSLTLGITINVIKQELMPFTGNFSHKSPNAFNSILVCFFQRQLMYIFLSKGMYFMHELASVLFMLNLCNQYNNKRNDS